MPSLYAPPRRPGHVLGYAVVVLTGMMAIASLAVDWGRVQLDKSQAQTAADAAALYAADSLIVSMPAAVRTRAISAAAQNQVEGRGVVLTNADIEFGIWDPPSKIFQVLDTASEPAATAVRVTVRLSRSRGTAVPLVFGGVVGMSSVDVSVTAIATIGRVYGADVPGLACPWLAGMPSGSVVPKAGWNSRDTVAPESTPTAFSAAAGKAYRFAKTAGSTTWSGGGSWTNAGTGSADAEGDTSTIATQNACNGMNVTHAPLNAMMGVFLNNTQPSSTGMAASLDFTTAAARDAATYAPALKQVFFIGDGLNPSIRLQAFTAPAGATRLYIGVMDASGWWWDNIGTIKFTVIEGQGAVLVK